MQKQEIIYNQACKSQLEICNSIEEKEKQKKDIDKYLVERDEINSNVQKRKETIKNYELKNSELDFEYNKLNDENNELIKKNTIV